MCIEIITAYRWVSDIESCLLRVYSCAYPCDNPIRLLIVSIVLDKITKKRQGLQKQRRCPTYTFRSDQEGTYAIKVSIDGIYSNSRSITVIPVEEIEVAQDKNSSNALLISSIAIVAVVIVGAAVLYVLKRRKTKSQ